MLSFTAFETTMTSSIDRLKILKKIVDVMFFG